MEEKKKAIGIAKEAAGRWTGEFDSNRRRIDRRSGNDGSKGGKGVS